MKFFSAVLFLLTVLLLGTASAQLDTAWLRQFDGTARGEEIFSDMVIDRMGNVYVTGVMSTISQTADIIVQKYDSTGQLVWSATYDGRAHQDDSAAALVVDSLGQVYVCGWVIDTVMDIDWVTLKYSATGQLLWARTWRRAFNQDDAGLALGLDQLGRVIVTGYCSDSTGNIDYCTICYNGATGDTVWVRYYNRTPENDEDISYAICVDDSNNVYVTGTSYDDGTDYDIATIRYTPTGVRSWLRRKNNYPWVGDDYGMRIKFDPVTRTIIIGGIVYDDNQDYNYFTMKYSRNGDSLWARAYNRYPANNEDLLYGLTLDQAGNVFVTGTSLDDITDYDIATVSYTSAGVPRWTQRYDGATLEDEGTDIVVDSSGQVLVVGNVDTRSTVRDVGVLKYDNNGNVLYSYLWDNPESHNEDLGYRIITSRDGFIYIGGMSFNDSTSYDLLIGKFYEVQHDFALTALVVPESLWIEDSFVPLAVVKNRAINRDSCWIKLTVTPGEYRDSVWLNLTPGMVDTIEFGVFRAESSGLFRVTSWSELPEDEKRFNDTLWAEVVVWEESVAVAEPKRFYGISAVTVAPNPVRSEGTVHLTGTPLGNVNFRMYDRTGALVQKWDFVFSSDGGSGSRTLRLDVRNLPAGVYFLQVDDSGRKQVRKVIVQH
ncbi:T9SS type A sorting domain-containing protein [candidate division WOR-3 bacterium]|nr:T9SS type A sorting domain-containing protein [candidate division WOR-3 bacterium]